MPGKSRRSQRSDAVDVAELQRLALPALYQRVLDLGVIPPHDADRHHLVLTILQAEFARGRTPRARGILEILPDGFGFVRSLVYDLAPGPDDFYVSPQHIRRLGLDTGHQVAGTLRVPKGNEKYYAIDEVLQVDGVPAGEREPPVPFDLLDARHPSERLILGSPDGRPGPRLIDEIAPMGKGQRSLVVAAPNTGVSTLLIAILQGIAENHPEIARLGVFLDQRPEDLGETEETLVANGCEVVGTTFDRPPARHEHAAEIAVERAKRLVEAGRDVVVILDSITALTRAYLAEGPESPRLLPNGLDPQAVHRTKQLLAAARNVPTGGSLTMITVARLAPGSTTDASLVEELYGTANHHVHLDAELALRDIRPALDVHETGTVHPEAFLPAKDHERLCELRSDLHELGPKQAVLRLLDQIEDAAG